MTHEPFAALFPHAIMNEQSNACPTYGIREVRQLPHYPIADDRSFAETVYPQQPGNVLPIDELVQTIRLIRSLHDVRAGLEKLQKKNPEAYAAVSKFFTSI